MLSPSSVYFFGWILMPILLQLGFAKGLNYALRRPTFSSSILPITRVTRGNEVDGNRGGNLMRDSCFLTGHEDTAPWWVVELQHPPGGHVVVNKVLIVDRSDAANARSSDYQIRVGSYFDNTTFDPLKFKLCHQHSGLLPVGPVTYECDFPIAGRYVSLNKFTSDDPKLRMCEVEVEIPVPPMYFQHGKNFKYLKQGSVEPVDDSQKLSSHMAASKSVCAGYCSSNAPWCQSFALQKVSDTRPQYQCDLYQVSLPALQASITKEFYANPTPLEVG